MRKSLVAAALALALVLGLGAAQVQAQLRIFGRSPSSTPTVMQGSGLVPAYYNMPGGSYQMVQPTTYLGGAMPTVSGVMPLGVMPGQMVPGSLPLSVTTTPSIVGTTPVINGNTPIYSGTTYPGVSNGTPVIMQTGTPMYSGGVSQVVMPYADQTGLSSTGQIVYPGTVPYAGTTPIYSTGMPSAYGSVPGTYGTTSMPIYTSPTGYYGSMGTVPTYSGTSYYPTTGTNYGTSSSSGRGGIFRNRMNRTRNSVDYYGPVNVSPMPITVGMPYGSGVYR